MPRSALPVRVARGVAAALLAAIVVVAPAAPAAAHAALSASQPGQNTRVAQSPEEIVLTFTEPLNGDYTTIVVSDAAGAQMPVDGPTVDQQRGIVRPVQPLPDGVYTVAYRVVSVDGHTVQGAFRFAVNAPLTGASGAPAQAGSAATDDAAPADSRRGWLLAFAGAVALLIGGAAVVVLRGRRRVS
ncbi:copper resistance protein CopC [Solwaraspora sp. WMMD791]|uniref:copper resistance CopC family protein n=1 Tax=Solwaraspora sp. WMMD791 TaxID=3016086 RepID=UPI00249CB110|nr:copper resistance CopC family protein [Solwaraspora sp. WMMD791]WFE29158.1 copper resistance protein CopC [Solwaraspora sp. WMMD791]